MQRQSFIQYDSNRGSAAAANREDTRPWRVVVNPHIERERRRNQVTRRARRLSRALCAVACGILATGLVGQITMSVALNAQSKRQSELYGQIQSLQSRKYMEQVSIENLSQVGRIEQEAQKLGMVYPQDDQLRALFIQLPGETTQLADAQP